MPRINQVFIDSVFYLYPTESAAFDGDKCGGTGFLVGFPSSVVQDKQYVYGVTNSHLLPDSLIESRFARFNLKNGGFGVIELANNEWIRHPDNDDVSICPIDLDFHKYECKFIQVGHFISQEVIRHYTIGCGDEVFMVSRFINHDGKNKNTPLVRFGHLAMMPIDPIRHPSGIDQESFLVEVLSMSGNSGSPVFVFVAPNWKRHRNNGWWMPDQQHGPWLLGINWGHLNDYLKITEQNRMTPISEGWVAESNAGLCGVIPAWKLLDILNMEALVKQREEGENLLKLAANNQLP